MLVHKYKVVEGKHQAGKDESGEHIFITKGQVIDLEDSVAAKFPGKFALMLEPVAGEAPAEVNDDEVPPGVETTTEIAPSEPPKPLPNTRNVRQGAR